MTPQAQLEADLEEATAASVRAWQTVIRWRALGVHPGSPQALRASRRIIDADVARRRLEEQAGLEPAPFPTAEIAAAFAATESQEMPSNAN